MTVITSTGNARIKGLRTLRGTKGRRSMGLTLAEGPLIAEAAVTHGARVHAIVALEGDELGPSLAERAGCEVITVSVPVLASIATTKEPQGPIAIVAPPPLRRVRAHDQVVLHDISDPGNLGTIVRTAVALGWDVVLSGSPADPWSPKAIRASAGTIFAAYLARVEDPVAGPSNAGVATAALVVRGGADPRREGEGPVGLIVGSEAHGLPKSVLEAVDQRLTIPMRGSVESLNAAVAAAIAMYALGR